MENAVRDSIEFTPIMKKAMKPMDSWHVTRREVKRERFRTQFCLARGFNQPLFVSYRAQLALRFQAVSRPLNPCMDAAFCRDRASSPSPNLDARMRAAPPRLARCSRGERPRPRRRRRL